MYFQVSYITFCVVACLQMSSSVPPGSSVECFPGLTEQQVLSILEEDYIELKDLVP